MKHDAILVVHYGQGEGQLFDSLEQLRMIEYVKAGGKFYGEGVDFRGEMGNSDPLFNGFWDYIGDSSEAMTAMFIRVDSVYGVPGEFAEGIGYAHPYPQTEWDAGGGFHINGMKGIVHVRASYGFDIAYMSQNPEVAAVLHWPIVSEHYDAFLSRVLCSYFSLCALDIPKTSHTKPGIAYDPLSASIRIPGSGRVQIIDILGRRVFEINTNASTIQVPASIIKGTYVVNWSNDDTQLAKTISIP